VLIVADGVGGWADSGVDPALYSKKLVKIME
jgi:serine/threonine protein phosphatase PrpC